MKEKGEFPDRLLIHATKFTATLKKIGYHPYAYPKGRT